MKAKTGPKQAADESLDDLLAQIQDAQARRMDWIELGAVIAKIRQQPEWAKSFSTREAFWDELGNVTGYGRNTLQRMTSTLEKLRLMQKAEPALLKAVVGKRAREEDVLARIIGNVQKAEFIARIYKYEPESAFRQIQQMTESRIPVIQLREVWNEIINSRPEMRSPGFVSPKKDGSKDLKQERLAELDEQRSLLYAGEDASIYFGRYKFELVSADAVGICCEKDGGLRFVDGFMIFDRVRPRTDSAFEECLAGIDYRARFFRHLWIFAPFEMDHTLDKIGDAMDKLGILQAGIVKYEDDVGLKIVRRPNGTEKPSRYQMVVQDVMRQGIPDFGVV